MWISICIEYPCKVSQFYNQPPDPMLSQKACQAFQGMQGHGKQTLPEQHKPFCALLAGGDQCSQSK